MCRNLAEEIKFQDAVESGTLCDEKFCPFLCKHKSPDNVCEGEYCEEAWENFCKTTEENSENLIKFFKEETKCQNSK